MAGSGAGGQSPTLLMRVGGPAGGGLWSWRPVAHPADESGRARGWRALELAVSRPQACVLMSWVYGFTLPLFCKSVC